jgi:hypothetical protein
MLRLVLTGMPQIKRLTETNWPSSRSMMKISLLNSRLKKRKLKLSRRPVKRNSKRLVRNLKKKRGASKKN